MSLLMPISTVSLIGASPIMACSVTDRVFNIVAEEFEVDRGDLTRETNFIEDLDADSAAIISIVSAFEDEFASEFEAAGIDQIPEDDYAKIPTIGAAIDYINGKIGK